MNKFERWLEEQQLKEFLAQHKVSPGISLVRFFVVGLTLFWFFTLVAATVFTITVGSSHVSLLVKIGLILFTFFHATTYIPQFIDFPPDEVIADADNFPQLNNLISDIATTYKVEKPTLVLAQVAGAALGKVGLLRRPVLMLGHPLISILSSNELVAVVAHEIGHIRDKSITRSLPVRIAFCSIEFWAMSVVPGEGWLSWRSLKGWQKILTVITTPVSLPLCALYTTFKFLNARDAVHSEYVADKFSFEISGIRDISGLTQKYLLSQDTGVMRSYVTASAQQRYDSLRAAYQDLAKIQPTRKRLLVHQGTGVFAWHPPIDLRQRFSKSLATHKQAYQIPDDVFRLIHSELKMWPVYIEQNEQRTLLDSQAQDSAETQTIVMSD